MLENIDLTRVLFMDVECVATAAEYHELDETFRELWKGKSRFLLRHLPEAEIDEEKYAEIYRQKAAIYAEFGKIICISVGYIAKRKEDGKPYIRLKSFADDDERPLLTAFSALLDQHYNNPTRHFICGHNIREFDVPYICRRLCVNQLPLPKLLDLHGKKPWETAHLLDTMELWKFGDYKSYTSLKLLAAVLGFPSPKDDIDGSDVGRVYWQEHDLQRIALYCEKDVLATAQLMLRYRRMPLLEAEQIEHVAQDNAAPPD